jgi:hypothetical protein
LEEAVFFEETAVFARFFLVLDFEAMLMGFVKENADKRRAQNAYTIRCRWALSTVQQSQKKFASARRPFQHCDCASGRRPPHQAAGL